MDYIHLKNKVKENEEKLNKLFDNIQGWEAWNSVEARGEVPIPAEKYEIEIILDREKLKKLPPVFKIVDQKEVKEPVLYKGKEYSFYYGYVVKSLDDVYSLFDIQDGPIKDAVVGEGVTNLLRYIDNK